MGLSEGNPGTGQKGISYLEGWQYGAGNQSEHGENLKTGILPIINICRIKTEKAERGMCFGNNKNIEYRWK